MATDQNLLVSNNPTNIVTITAPSIQLYNTAISGGEVSATTVVSQLALTVMYEQTRYTIIEVIYTFELLSALLDSAPTGSKNPTLFYIQIQIPGNVTETTQYVVDATIQTKGNSALSPTYVTQAYKIDAGQFAIGFPVTNFFNVSAPGAPYTLFLTIQRVV